MSGPRQLRCPNCGGPTTYRARTCGFCGGALTWIGDLLLSRGAEVETYELAKVALPDPVSKVHPKKVQGGVQLNLERSQLHSGLLKAPRRNGTVIIDGVCLDDAGAFGVLLRVSAVADSRVGYAITLRPGRRSVQVVRLAWNTSCTSTQRVLSAWQAHPQVHPVGVANRLEVRAADSMIQVLVNDQPISEVIDASFGWGRAGWRALAVDGSARVQLQRVGLFEVA